MVIHKKATKESTNEDESKFIKIWNFLYFYKDDEQEDDD
jgi:hypothetical protein